VKAWRLFPWAWIAAAGASRLGASAIHESAPLFTRITQTATISAEVSGTGMFVSVMINGQGPFRMQVDTGCSNSIISPEVAAAVEARGIDSEDDDTQAVNGLGEVVSMPRVLLDSVALGGVQLEGVVAGVVPLELQSKIDSRAVDGLLGYSVFSDIFFALDFPGQDLVLSTAWPKNLPQVRAELAVIEHSGVPFITAKLQGRDFDLMVDSGANDRVQLPPEETASLSWKNGPRPGFLLAVVGDVAREQIGRLSGSLELGQLRQPEPVVAVSAGPPTIGTGLLRSLCLVFHEAEDKLWLCSAQDGPLPSPPERSVGLSMFADTGGWRVVGIIPNSPAEEAAISAGDLVTQIEGQPAHGWTRDQIQSWIDTHATLSIRLSSKSTERDISLRVWLLVP
jgi:predicted aspartyl protease